MEVKIFEGKDFEDVKKKALEELNIPEIDVLIRKEEKKGGLFKSGTIAVEILPLQEVLEYSEKVLKEILEAMSLEVRFESKIREGAITIKMYSDNNSILIGKNGRTIEALQTIVRTSINKETRFFVNLILDVENYKEKQEAYLIRLAKNVAREVRTSKVPATLENMNSYERRIVHNALTDFKGIETTSEGEEPERHIVIKPKED